MLSYTYAFGILPIVLFPQVQKELRKNNYVSLYKPLAYLCFMVSSFQCFWTNLQCVLCSLLLWAPFLNFRKFPRDPSMKYPWETPEDPSKIKNAYLKYPWAAPEDYD